MLVEGLGANAVNVSGFKALQMSACFIFYLFFPLFPKSAKTKPGTNLSGLRTGSIMDETPASKEETLQGTDLMQASQQAILVQHKLTKATN